MILEHDKAVRLTKKEISCAVLSNQEMVIETYIRAAPKPADRANLMLMESSALGKRSKAPDGPDRRSRGLNQSKLKLFRWSVVRPIL